MLGDVLIFAVGIAVGAVISWLAVSGIYYEGLRQRGLIDERGRWIERKDRPDR